MQQRGTEEAAGRRCAESEDKRAAQSLQPLIVPPALLFTVPFASLLSPFSPCCLIVDGLASPSITLHTCAEATPWLSRCFHLMRFAALRYLSSRFCARVGRTVVLQGFLVCGPYCGMFIFFIPVRPLLRLLGLHGLQSWLLCSAAETLQTRRCHGATLSGPWSMPCCLLVAPTEVAMCLLSILIT